MATPTVLIQILLPTAPTPGGSGTDPAAALALTHKELVATFSGLTAYVRAPAHGVWTAPDGRVRRDDVLMVEILADNFDRLWWRRYTATLAARFEQETIHVRALSIDTPDADG